MIIRLTLSKIQSGMFEHHTIRHVLRRRPMVDEVARRCTEVEAAPEVDNLLTNTPAAEVSRALLARFAGRQALQRSGRSRRKRPVRYS